MFSQVECLLILRVCLCVLLLKFKRAYCSILFSEAHALECKHPPTGTELLSVRRDKTKICRLSYSALRFWAWCRLTNAFGGKDYLVTSMVDYLTCKRWQGVWQRVRGLVKKIFRVPQQGRSGKKSLHYSGKTGCQLGSYMGLVWKA